ncbi:hypothetical protein, partial [Methylicorpusculum sp.]|uniref:hypothetical protein n=1 Tax=Methylicorpusculum sp. TaxID=2713644 RepID=UPI002AB9F79B
GRNGWHGRHDVIADPSALSLNQAPADFSRGFFMGMICNYSVKTLKDTCGTCVGWVSSIERNPTIEAISIR